MRIADSALDNIIRLVRPDSRLILKKISHKIVPNRSGASNARGKVAHRLIIIIADPNSNEKVGSIADGPIVFKIIGGAGFNRDDLIFDAKLRIWTKGIRASRIILENVGDDIGNSRWKDWFAGRVFRSLIKDFAI